MLKKRCTLRYLLLCNVVNATKASVTVIYGEDDYLRRQAEQEVRAGFAIVSNLDVQQLSKEEFVLRCCQRELFQTDVQLFIMRSKDEHRNLWQALAATKLKLCHAVLFNCRKKSLSATLQKTLKTLKVKSIACPTPRMYEYTKHLQQICVRYQLQLEPRGQQLLLEHCGMQLETLANEVQKLALIFGTSKVTAQDVAPHLGLLREDSSFVIIDLLLGKQYSQAQLAVAKLLQRGESALSILGLLAYFLRNLILASEGQLKLAPRQVSRYQSFARTCQPAICLDLLATCQQADMDLKTSRARPELVLGNILLQFPH